MASHVKQVICSAIIGAIGLILSSAALVRADDDAGRTAYVEVCQRCHGLITERTSAFSARVVPVVMLPLGPNLTGIIGRPIGSIKGFRYSNAMQALAATGAVWDLATLDQYLTDSQKFVRGSYMFLKVAQPKRKQVLDYLDRVARYRR
ncbi:MAG: c-type cytochrome [Hyphomicrobiaceae bacterium]